MRDWSKIGQGLTLGIPDADLAAAAASLHQVDAVFAPMVRRIPLETEPAYMSVRFPEDEEPQ